MECSPTWKFLQKGMPTSVAVPVNYGMLSYTKIPVIWNDAHSSQSPSIMECSPTLDEVLVSLKELVAVPVNYGMLSYSKDWWCGYRKKVAVPVNYGMLSYVAWRWFKAQSSVAVPVNYGMLSYTNVVCVHSEEVRRSPRQLWNALLHLNHLTMANGTVSQSPSIMECSPTWIVGMR